jgi:hypothetical protein
MTGYIHQDRNPKDWIFGGVEGYGFPSVNKAGDWRAYMPEGERQRRYGLETMSCVSQALCNCLEIYAHGMGIGEFNFSDRFLAKTSGTTKQGNSFWRVWMAARTFGLAPEDSWGWSSDINEWGEYYSEPSDDAEMMASMFASAYEIPFRWVNHNEADMRKALESAPLWVASNRHAYVLTDFEDGWVKFDSYPGIDGDGEEILPTNHSFSAVAQVAMTEEKKEFKFKNDSLIWEQENRGRWGLHVSGKMYVDGLSKLQAMWQLRNRDKETDIFDKAPMMQVSTAEFDSIPHFNLKNEAL